MKVCVFGAGAVGGMIGARLSLSGVPVSVVARGETLGALRRKGLVLRHAHGESVAAVRATDTPADLGPQDLVILAVKEPALSQATAALAPLLGPDTTVLVALNGVPWWFFHRFESPLKGLQLRSLDPDGLIERALPTDFLLGCVVRFAASVAEPGVIQHTGGMQLIVGEPSGDASPRLAAVTELLSRAEFDTVSSTAIHKDIWYKLWGNMTMNPISAFTGATSTQILSDPLVEAFALQVMEEAARLGSLIGCPINQTGRDRNEETRQIPPFKTSMLQDVESGRSTEIDALLSAVLEIGKNLHTPTPNIETLLGLTRLHARVRGLYP